MSAAKALPIAQSIKRPRTLANSGIPVNSTIIDLCDEGEWYGGEDGQSSV